MQVMGKTKKVGGGGLSKIRAACCRERKWSHGNQKKTVYMDIRKNMIFTKETDQRVDIETHVKGEGMEKEGGVRSSHAPLLQPLIQSELLIGSLPHRSLV